MDTDTARTAAKVMAAVGLGLTLNRVSDQVLAGILFGLAMYFLLTFAEHLAVLVVSNLAKVLRRG